MTWRWKQALGLMMHDANIIGRGYSGAPGAVNNPAQEAKKDVGPIPRGAYIIGAPVDLDGGDHGPFVLPLTPCDHSKTFGRGGFLIHGDSIRFPGSASHGCIILSRQVRVYIAQSGDHVLRVE